jgi:hypothetical protein
VRRYREKMNSGHDFGIEFRRALDMLPAGNMRISGEDLLLSVQAFKEKYGHVQIPRTYVVPDSSDWPEKSRGVSLGSRIMDIRRKKIGKLFLQIHFLFLLIKKKKEREIKKSIFIGTEDLRIKLGDLGVNMAVRSATVEYEHIHRFDDILVALKVYLSIHGNLNVPRG